MGVRSVPGLFTRNERVVVTIDSDSHGRVAVVLVGATNVGRIQLAFAELATNRGHAPGRFAPPAPIPIRRGDELGVFNLGSTVVLLLADPRLEPAFRHGCARASRPGARFAARSPPCCCCCAPARSRPRPPRRSRCAPARSCAGRARASSGARSARSASSRSPGPASCRSTCCARPGRSSCAASARGSSSGDGERGALRLPGAAAHAAAARWWSCRRRTSRASERERREMARLWKLRGPRRFSLPLVAPLDPLPAGGHFGDRRVINGEWRSPHGGRGFQRAARHARASRGRRYRGDGGEPLLRGQRRVRGPRRRPRLAVLPPEPDRRGRGPAARRAGRSWAPSARPAARRVPTSTSASAGAARASYPPCCSPRRALCLASTRPRA